MSLFINNFGWFLVIYNVDSIFKYSFVLIVNIPGSSFVFPSVKDYWHRWGTIKLRRSCLHWVIGQLDLVYPLVLMSCHWYFKENFDSLNWIGVIKGFYFNKDSSYVCIGLPLLCYVMKFFELWIRQWLIDRFNDLQHRNKEIKTLSSSQVLCSNRIPTGYLSNDSFILYLEYLSIRE